jgi:PAS domain-containing protein
VVKIRRSASMPQHLLVTDHRGNITYTTASTAELLGYSVKQLLRMDVTRLLPLPFSLLHHKWMKASGLPRMNASCLP